MSAKTEYLRAELNTAKAALNNQTLRLAAVKKIDEGLAILNGRDVIDNAGVSLPAMDTSIVGAIYDGAKAAIDACNASDVALKSKATILSELSAL